jgi:hypothetical protein
MNTLFNHFTSSIAIKIIILYALIMALYYYIDSSVWRFILTMVLFSISLIIFHIPFNYALFILILGLCAAITEHIFIKYMNVTWDYRMPDIIDIPYWLVPLWAITIVIISEVCFRFRTLFTNVKT